MADRRRIAWQERGRRGIALLAVLFGLAIISVLIAASLGRTAAHVMVLKQATAGLEADALHQGALTVAGVWIAEQDIEGAVRTTVSIDGRPVEVHAQDVTGLIDLGSGDVELVMQLITALAEQPAVDAQARLEALRSAKEPIQSVGELLRLGLVGYQDYAAVAPLMTVFSGRAGVDLSQAPELLRGVLGDGGQDGSNRLRRGRRMQVILEARSRSSGAVVAISGGAEAGVRVEAIERWRLLNLPPNGWQIEDQTTDPVKFASAH